MNMFGFKMLDAAQTGEIYSTDISDMIQNALAGCQEIPAEKLYLYPHMNHTAKRG